MTTATHRFAVFVGALLIGALWHHLTPVWAMIFGG